MQRTFEHPLQVGPPPGVDLELVDEDLVEPLQAAEWYFSFNSLLALIVRYPLIRFARFLSSPHKLEVDGSHEGDIEATVTETPRGIITNFAEDGQSKRDPRATEVADDEPTCKPRFDSKAFGLLRSQVTEWFMSLAEENEMSGKGELIAVPYRVGRGKLQANSVLLAPKSCAVFAFWLALLQFIKRVPAIANDGFKVQHVLCLAPPFRHSWFSGDQKVITRRSKEKGFASTWAFTLYPGPSGKKGIYGILLWLARLIDDCCTVLHGAAVRIMTKVKTSVLWIHMGPSGSGKSETLLPAHYEADGSYIIATNVVTGEVIRHNLKDPPPTALHFLADDMTLVWIEDGFLVFGDGENGWFIRMDGATHPGADPFIEFLWDLRGAHRAMMSIEPSLDPKPWNHLRMLDNRKRNSNPRLKVERRHVPNIIEDVVKVGEGESSLVLSQGVRCPEFDPSKSEEGQDSWAILGAMQVVPWWLFWVWSLLSIRAVNNPSIHPGLKVLVSWIFERVGAYRDFLTGDEWEEGNRLYRLFGRMPEDTVFLLLPNQWVGCSKLGGHGFSPQNLLRRLLYEGSYPEADDWSRFPLVGKYVKPFEADGFSPSKALRRPEKMEGFGEENYDRGVIVLATAFLPELREFRDSGEMDEGPMVVLNHVIDYLEKVVAGEDPGSFEIDAPKPPEYEQAAA